ncbi:hypothetical protein GCM10011369_00380 [Neiella marina]|uniref:DUF2145 domain-containing protein n=1 Tax=Neiella marina TaxID=508461 RepID=A0A8J2U1N8_9GAMM|nr:DUF2145 domain-containing protein [Neiella marina]GGA63020.1 hypothetical protein GCM10011369_00380 [Neiella marina]
MKRLLAVFCTLIVAARLPAWAGSEQNRQAQFEPQQIATFAKQVEQYAAGQGAHAFIIARVGRPAEDLPEGIRFTHTAIAVYSMIETASGEKLPGYAIHNLYQYADSPERSKLVIDYPVDFFWGVQSLEAGIIIPKPALQKRLVNLIASGANQQLHNPSYSVIANPFDLTYQNCTEHTLDLLNAAIYQTEDRGQLKANAKAHFQPQAVAASRFKLMLGSWLMADVETSDHGDQVATATFSTIGQYLLDYGLAQQAVIMTEQGTTQPLLDAPLI